MSELVQRSKGVVYPCHECLEFETMGEGDRCSGNCPGEPVEVETMLLPTCITADNGGEWKDE